MAYKKFLASEQNPNVHVRIDLQQAISTKKQVLISEIDILKLIKGMNNYAQIRRRELELREELKKESKELNDLPSMTQNSNKWNIQAVKEAVSSSQNNNIPTQDFSDEVSSGNREVIGSGVPRTRPINYPLPPASSQQNNNRREPLFVRIDKFESALRDFEDISIKIKRVEELITEIKELRDREDREFSEWEKDLQVVKSRLDSIDRTLFSQLD